MSPAPHSWWASWREVEILPQAANLRHFCLGRAHSEQQVQQVSGYTFSKTHVRHRCSPINLKSGENSMCVRFNLSSHKPHPRLKFLQGPCRKQCLAPLCASPECLTEVWENTNNSPLGRVGKKKKTELAIQAGKGTGMPVCKIIRVHDSLPLPLPTSALSV